MHVKFLARIKITPSETFIKLLVSSLTEQKKISEEIINSKHQLKIVLHFKSLLPIFSSLLVFDQLTTN